MPIADRIYKRSRMKNGLIYNLCKRYDIYILLIPGIVIYILFHYIPMYGLIIAFQDFHIMDGFSGSKFVGLKHFINFVNDPYFSRLIRNTFLLSLYGPLWGFWQHILFALLLNELKNKLFKRITQTVSYLPYFISTVIIVGMLMQFTLTDGPINDFLVSIGIGRQRFWLDSKWFRSLYIGSGIWQGLGWGSILYLSALSGISEELYEAAIIDGATRLQRVRFITIPGIMPTIVILLIFNVSGLVSVGFEKAFLMQNPAIYETADVISTYVYRRGLLDARFSYGAAIGLFNSVIAFMLIAIANKTAKKLSEISLW